MPVPTVYMFSTSARSVFERLQQRLPPGKQNQLAPGGGGQGFDYLSFINQMSEAICYAWEWWQQSALLSNVDINGVMASGGKVSGNPWPYMMERFRQTNPTSSVKLATSISDALGESWLYVTNSISVPAIPWYPAFAAVPAAAAPPTPNVPTPLASLDMNRGIVQRFRLQNDMLMRHGYQGALQSDKNLFEALAEAFEQAFQIWTASTMVTMVIGTGRVPTFAPPHVPVGPVVAGKGNMALGGFR